MYSDMCNISFYGDNLQTVVSTVERSVREKRISRRIVPIFFVRRATAEVASKIVPKGRKKSFNCRFQVFYVVIILLKPA